MNQQTPLKTHANKCHAFIKSDNECVCDGYHTFNELYDHRNALFIALCKVVDIFFEGSEKNKVWRAQLHSDGTQYDGWFILGINEKKGKQMTYHLPMSLWNATDFAVDLGRAPEFDGHTSDDVLNRLKQI